MSSAPTCVRANSSLTAAPQYPWFQVNSMGLERPLFFKGEGTHHVRLVVDDDIATIFVD